MSMGALYRPRLKWIWTRVGKGGRMGYDFHLAEWKSALEAVPDVRPAPEPHLRGEHPTTGEKIAILFGPEAGRAEVFEDGEWEHGFHLSHGAATWRAHEWDAEDPQTRAACGLARALRAQIFGDDGEEYPLFP